MEYIFCFYNGNLLSLHTVGNFHRAHPIHPYNHLCHRKTTIREYICNLHARGIYANLKTKNKNSWNYSMSKEFLSFSKISWNYRELHWFITVSRVFFKIVNANLLCSFYFCKCGPARHCRHHSHYRNRISTKLGYICRCCRRIPFPDRTHDYLKWKWAVD